MVRPAARTRRARRATRHGDVSFLQCATTTLIESLLTAGPATKGEGEPEPIGLLTRSARRAAGRTSGTGPSRACTFLFLVGFAHRGISRLPHGPRRDHEPVSDTEISSHIGSLAATAILHPSRELTVDRIEQHLLHLTFVGPNAAHVASSFGETDARPRTSRISIKASSIAGGDRTPKRRPIRRPLFADRGALIREKTEVTRRKESWRYSVALLVRRKPLQQTSENPDRVQGSEFVGHAREEFGLVRLASSSCRLSIMDT